MANWGGSITVVNHPDAAREPFAVLNKPAGLPSGPGAKCEANCSSCAAPCALGWAMERYPSIRGINAAPGRHDYGLVHRLDTAASGLLLVALTQTAYDCLLAEQRACRFVKEYRALCTIKNEHDNDKNDEKTDKRDVEHNGFPPCPVQWERSTDGQFYILESRFRPWGIRGQAVRPVTNESGLAAQKKAAPRTYRTGIRVSPPTGAMLEATCRITEGFRHQVRCHLAWLGLPVVGDELYTRRRGETPECNTTGVHQPAGTGDTRRRGETPECNTTGVQRLTGGTVDGGELPSDALPLMPMKVLPKKKGMYFFAAGLAFRLDKDYFFRI